MIPKSNCDFCDTRDNTDKLIRVGTSNLCQGCYKKLVTSCKQCNTTIWIEDNAGSKSIPLCKDCFTGLYAYCNKCGAVIKKVESYKHNGNLFCLQCFRNIPENLSIIHNSKYKAFPLIYGVMSTPNAYQISLPNNNFAPLILGVELEIDAGGADYNNAKVFLDYINTKADGERIYIKFDDSLQNGFEIVSHPMTLDYHLNHMPWLKILQIGNVLHYKSDKTLTCGLHVHVNRSYFKTADQFSRQNSDSIKNLLKITESCWDQLVTFSRRTQKQIRRWSHPYGKRLQPLLMDTRKPLEYSESARRTFINLTNLYTVEFRIFRGTMDVTTLYATLELVGSLCYLATFLPIEDIPNFKWGDYIDLLRKLPPLYTTHLTKYLTDNGLLT